MGQVDQEKAKVCAVIKHAFKPRDAEAPIPEFETCTYCGTQVEVLVPRQTEYRKAADIGVKLPDPKVYSLKVAPDQFAELKAMGEAAGAWYPGGSFKREYNPKSPLEKMFDAWVVMKYPQLRNHLGPVSVEIDWLAVDKKRA